MRTSRVMKTWAVPGEEINAEFAEGAEDAENDGRAGSSLRSTPCGRVDRGWSLRRTTPAAARHPRDVVAEWC